MRSLVCLAFVALATGCTASVTPAEDAPPPVVVSTTGTLTVDWTINGTKDPNQCSQGAASAIEIAVTDDSGRSAGVYQQSCTAFATSITLDAGAYTATARLVDSASVPRTTAVPINRFTLHGADELDTPIDFSAASFF